MKFSNPRTLAVCEDWPFGGSRLCTMTFEIESHPTRGERCVRTSTTPNGRVSQPKKGTYSTMCRIVDGDDGRTYILEYNKIYQMIQVRESNLKFSVSTSYPRDADYAELWAIFHEERHKEFVSSLIDDVAKATEFFSEDELEREAARNRKEKTIDN